MSDTASESRVLSRSFRGGESAAAEELQVPVGSPGLRIVHTYFVRNRVIEVTVGVHPASLFSYSMTFQLAQTVV